MDSLSIAQAVFSTLFRLVAFIFLRVIPSPLAKAALPVLYIAYLTTAFFTPKKIKEIKVEQSKQAPVENGATAVAAAQDVKVEDITEKPAAENGPVIAQDSEEEDVFRTIALSLPTRSPRLRRANAAINGLLVLMAIEFIATPFLDTAADLSFSRVGAVSADSVKIAVRFPTVNATAQLLWREQKDPENPSPWRNGPPLSFSAAADYVNTVKLSGLWPNTSYEYAIADENRTVTSGPFEFRTFPDSRLSTGSHFRFVASSCITPNFPYLPLHGRTIKGFDLLANYLFPATAPAEPVPPTEFMLFLGDFIYSDVPQYIGDDKEAYRRLYRRNYQSTSFKKIYERLPIFHTYDDHEIKNNYAGLGNDSQPPFPSASDAFKIYNADTNYDSLADQHYYNFRYGDAAFFVLDTRRYRIPATEEAPAAGTMLGETQLAALHSWLAHANNTASFKRTLGGGFPAEKAALLEALHSVPNLIIISGDRHEFASIEFNSEHLHTVREYSTSPLSMFDIPFVRTLRMQSEETVAQNHSEMVVTEEGPVYVTETVQVPKERVVKYMARGNVKWQVMRILSLYIIEHHFRSSFEMDTRDLTRPVLRIEVVIDGKVKYREELVGSPVKLQSSNALGVFVTHGIKDMFQRIGLSNPSRWF
ncbi:Alkaline phosphatase D [Mycena venus]|uniref:Alkaline phosphatase D n=1 Tax=Mycena venus TaxID=2733690 RepID=A0A8H6XDG5_9AGAR|nr:Alkaline phosphatase D [Mycena venus]